MCGAHVVRMWAFSSEMEMKILVLFRHKDFIMVDIMLRSMMNSVTKLQTVTSNKTFAK